MSDHQNGNAEENDNVIQGPWPKLKRRVKIPDEEFLRLQENMEFAEELNQKIIVQMIHTLGENGIGVSEDRLKNTKGFGILSIQYQLDQIQGRYDVSQLTTPFRGSRFKITVQK